MPYRPYTYTTYTPGQGGRGRGPGSRRMEGGKLDAFGHPAYTIDQYLAGLAGTGPKVPYAVVAMNKNDPRFGQSFTIPGPHGEQIPVRATDTGKRLKVGQIDVATSDPAAAISTPSYLANAPQPTFNVPSGHPGSGGPTHLAEGITGALGHLPGIYGAPFKLANAGIKLGAGIHARRMNAPGSGVPRGQFNPLNPYTPQSQAQGPRGDVLNKSGVTALDFGMVNRQPASVFNLPAQQPQQFNDVLDKSGVTTWNISPAQQPQQFGDVLNKSGVTTTDLGQQPQGVFSPDLEAINPLPGQPIPNNPAFSPQMQADINRYNASLQAQGSTGRNPNAAADANNPNIPSFGPVNVTAGPVAGGRPGQRGIPQQVQQTHGIFGQPGVGQTPGNTPNYFGMGGGFTGSAGGTGTGAFGFGGGTGYGTGVGGMAVQNFGDLGGSASPSAGLGIGEANPGQMAYHERHPEQFGPTSAPMTTEQVAWQYMNAMANRGRSAGGANAGGQYGAHLSSYQGPNNQQLRAMIANPYSGANRPSASAADTARMVAMFPQITGYSDYATQPDQPMSNGPAIGHMAPTGAPDIGGGILANPTPYPAVATHYGGPGIAPNPYPAAAMHYGGPGIAPPAFTPGAGRGVTPAGGPPAFTPRAGRGIDPAMATRPMPLNPMHPWHPLHRQFRHPLLDMANV